MRKLIAVSVTAGALLLGALPASASVSAPHAILVGEGLLCDGHGVCAVYSKGVIVTEPGYKTDGNKDAQWQVWWYGTTSWSLFNPKYWNFEWAGKHLRKRMVTYRNVGDHDQCLGGFGKTVFPVLCSAGQNGWIQADGGALYEIRYPGPPPSEPEIPGALTSLTSFGPAWVLPFAGTPGQKWSIKPPA